jgi:MFS transporter, MHS family, proline/betaine transporter
MRKFKDFSVILTVVTPFAGYLSDRIGRRKQIATVAVLFIVTAYPAFSYVVSHVSATGLFLSSAGCLS